MGRRHPVGGRHLDSDRDAALSGLYSTIVADPPWPYKRGLPRWTANGVDNSDNLPYETLDLESLKALEIPVANDAHLYLWTTGPFLEVAPSVARAWGFKPSITNVWCKPARGFSGKATFSPCTEFFLFCRRGSLKAKRSEYRNWWTWPRATHSQKPEAFYDLVEEISPGPYLELFARRQRLGWDTWGNEALEHVSLI